MTEEEKSTHLDDLRREYRQLCHAIQIGVAMSLEMDFDPQLSKAAACPKHLRTGLNIIFSDHGALVGLLMEKGIITEEEYLTAIVKGAKREVDFQKGLIPERLGGAKVTLS